MCASAQWWLKADSSAVVAGGVAWVLSPGQIRRGKLSKRLSKQLSRLDSRRG